MGVWQAESMSFEDTSNNGQLYYHWDNFAVNIAWDFNHDTGSEIQIVMDKGRNTHFRRCLYGKSINEIQLEYVKQFWDKYNDTRKAFRTVFNENHEATGELIKYNDNNFVSLLQHFKEKDYLKDTIVLLVSDHGAHFIVARTSFLPDDSRLQENFLALLIILTPKDIPKENLKFLESNQQQFISPQEVYVIQANKTKLSYIYFKIKINRFFSLKIILNVSQILFLFIYFEVKL